MLHGMGHASTQLPCLLGDSLVAPRSRQISASAAIIQRMECAVIAVHPGTPTMVDAMMAGVRVQAEWCGAQPTTGDHVDVELDIDEVLDWAHSIAVQGDEMTLREGPLLRGVVEMQDRKLLTVRVLGGLAMVEVNDYSFDVTSGTAIALVTEHLKLYPTGT
ncbi:hypothetical protein [Actinoplanes campanulatus]|uniref:hypothetical protein n=2 Tax=Actinoplanes campanulatus TaxID=113559 RepID=UPI0031D3A296